VLLGGAVSAMAQADPPVQPLRISAASTVMDTGIIQALADKFHAHHPDIAV